MICPKCRGWNQRVKVESERCRVYIVRAGVARVGYARLAGEEERETGLEV